MHPVTSVLPLDSSVFTCLVEQTTDMVMITDLDGYIVYVNHAWEVGTGHRYDQVLGKTPALLRSDQHDQHFYRRLWNSLNQGRDFHDIFINRRADGTLFYEEKTLIALRDSDNNITHYASIGNSITQNQSTQERLVWLMHHDPVTGLPNRTMMLSQLDEEISRAKHHQHQLAVICLDLDRFKTLNDSLGPQLGDELLHQVACRLQEMLPENAMLARNSSDEFIAIFPSIRNTRTLAYTAHKLLHELERPFLLGDRESYISASMGISIYPDDGHKADQILRNVDAAMHRAKKSGGQQYHFYTEDMMYAAHDRFKLENQLRQALLHKEFYLEYQPRIAMSDGSLRSVEALLRWKNPEGIPVSPAEFIPMLEDMGLITSVGEWVLLTACRQLTQWHSMDLPPFRVSVNLSAKQFQQSNLTEVVAKSLSHAKLEAQWLELEITESLMIENFHQSLEALQELREMGVSLALDDFGAGYSSLGYLKHLPIQTLKIDRGFITDLVYDPADVAIVQAVTGMAHRMGISVTAEGVETSEQLALLAELGCEEGQGFYMGRPMAAEALVEWLTQPQTFRQQLTSPAHN